MKSHGRGLWSIGNNQRLSGGRVNRLVEGGMRKEIERYKDKKPNRSLKLTESFSKLRENDPRIKILAIILIAMVLSAEITPVAGEIIRRKRVSPRNIKDFSNEEDQVTKEAKNYGVSQDDLREANYFLEKNSAFDLEQFANDAANFTKGVFVGHYNSIVDFAQHYIKRIPTTFLPGAYAAEGAVTVRDNKGEDVGEIIQMAVVDGGGNSIRMEQKPNGKGVAPPKKKEGEERKSEYEMILHRAREQKRKEQHITGYERIANNYQTNKFYEGKLLSIVESAINKPGFLNDAALTKIIF